MDRGSASESRLLSLIESSDEIIGFKQLVTGYLRSFAPFLKRSQAAACKPAKHSKSNPTGNAQVFRSLAKEFLPFLHKSLSLLPKRLSGLPKIPRESAVELLDVYRLCLDCLDVIAPELSGKPYSVQVQRIRFVHSLEHWELYEEAQAEGFLLLQNLKATYEGGSKGNSGKRKTTFVPLLNTENEDREAASIIVELVVTLVKFASKLKKKVDSEYWTVISMVNESDPWFKILDSESYMKFHRFLQSYLHIITLFLVGELKSFHVDLICEFSQCTFKEYKKSSAHDQTCKVALKICSLLFSQIDKMPCDPILDVLKHVLRFMASESKSRIEGKLEFLELLHYCANKSLSATMYLCDQLAEHLHELADALLEDPPFISSIIMLYEFGLLGSPLRFRLEAEDTDDYSTRPCGSILQFLINNKEKLQHVAASINLFNCLLNIGVKDNSLLAKASLFSSSYWEALKFFCLSIAKSINGNKRGIILEADCSSFPEDLACIHDMFHLCYQNYIQRISATENQRDISIDNHSVISALLVADLILVLRTKQNVKESTEMIKFVISTDYIPHKWLKNLCISLNNIAVIFQQKKWLKEARKTLHLCCKTLWKYVLDLCKIDKTDWTDGDGELEKIVADSVMEASDKTAFLLKLNQESNLKVSRIVTESLRCWSILGNFVATVPIPRSLVMEWVQIRCMRSKDADIENGMTLHSLLSSSDELPTSMLGIILEEELLVYDEKSYLNPQYCLRMRLKITNLLLEEVYEFKGSEMNKCKILIKKAEALRAIGLEKLDECMQCLSFAISMLKPIYKTKKGCTSQVCHLLVHAHIFYAICIQEAFPRSPILSRKSEFLRNINDALKLVIGSDHVHMDEHDENMAFLWYQVIDMLSIRGYMEMHPRLFDVLIILSNKQKIPFAKTFSGLWKSKRLSHGLCAFPVNPMFNETFCKHQENFLGSSGFWTACKEELEEYVVGFSRTSDETKKAAADIVSHAPLTGGSIFLASNLYYDSSVRLISCGRIAEALTCAKEAHSLRGKLLQQKFKYSVENTVETNDVNGDATEKSLYTIQAFTVIDAMKMKSSNNFKGCVVTAWNVLSCYLESVLQVGVIQEILGNVSDAERLLSWGRNVSQFQGLLLFEVHFSSMLGKLYRKQRNWSMAEKELSTAKKNLADNCDTISCKHCLYLVEAFINQQLGELFCCGYSSSGDSSCNKLIEAKKLYISAFDKLNLCDQWTVCSSSENTNAKQVKVRQRPLSGCPANALKINVSLPNDKSDVKAECGKGRKSKTESKSTISGRSTANGGNRKITRPKQNPVGETSELQSCHRENGPTSSLASEDFCITSACSDQPAAESIPSISDLHFNMTSIYDKLKCLHCVHAGAVNSRNLNSFIYVNWELVFRKLCFRLLISLGKVYSISGNVHEAHELILKSLLVLLGRNYCWSKSSSDYIVSSLESIGQNFPGDVLAIERSALLYYACWFSLKSSHSRDARQRLAQSHRKFCCKLPSIEVAEIVAFLRMAFILSQEFPLFFQKISRLLAVVYILATSLDHFLLTPSEEGSESQWAAFFHQASLGTNINQQMFLGKTPKQSQSARDSEDSISWKPISSTIQDPTTSIRVAPRSIEELEDFVARFFEDLPSTPIICISLLAGADGMILRELLLHSSPTEQTWIVISHLSSNRQNSVLLPLNNILKGDSSGSPIDDGIDFPKKWRCPWVSTSIDDIAPVFRHILEGNYYSSSQYFLQYVKEDASLWWEKRTELNDRLSKFLQDMEDSWLGAWKYLLLGEWPDYESDDPALKQLLLSAREQHLLNLIVSRNCYVGTGSRRCSGDLENAVHQLFKRKLELFIGHRSEDTRKPIILVLDFEVQMLPWESLPILRGQEVYRMPSVGSIFAILSRFQNPPSFPIIDPQDSYYLLNPGGDLVRTQNEFQDWFRDQEMMEGKTGSAPTVEELSSALGSHDLFIYFGHGSGMQYIPPHEIQKLDGCAATLLLGCSSGCLHLRGSYVPRGAPISYLLAGAPAIVANLWEVTDRDIDRFGKAVLNAWMRERRRAAGAGECCCGGGREWCEHRARIGSFMEEGREACALRFLIGAAPVCYGVPTGIVKRGGGRRRKDR